MPLQFSFQQQSFLPEEEKLLIERAQKDPRFFAPLYERYHDAIFRYVYRRVDEEEQAYDEIKLEILCLSILLTFIVVNLFNFFLQTEFDY